MLERLLAGVGSAWGGVQRWAGVVAGYLEPHEPPDASESESRQPSDGSEPEDGLDPQQPLQQQFPFSFPLSIYIYVYIYISPK